jgi:hypothetical protein
VNGYEIIAASGTRSAAFISPDYYNYQYTGAKVLVSVDSITAGGLTVAIEGRDRVSQKYYTILASTPILSSQDKLLTVHPGVTAANNASVADALPDIWRVNVTAASGVASYSIGASLIE